jgi:phenylalanyl-tRNA synthetase beta chain
VKVPLSWLREFVDVTVEPRRLGDDLTMVGLALEGLEKDGQDTVLDIDVTTNRVDAMNVYGIAREVSVIYGLPLRPLDLALAESGPPAAEALRVEIEAPDLCPRFCARVLDVRLGPSPAWIRDRLEQVGVRPINNVVDLTNYVMLEMGHPSHAFDLARIPGGRLNVRWAREGEKLTTLDGAPRTLTARMGVVAGPEAALALAGIMGGASSEVSEDTRTVALEAAYWDPLSIRRTAKALGMRTEASHRFERGADPEGTAVATARIAHLLQKIGGGSVRPGLIDRLAAKVPKRKTSLRYARLGQILGTDVPEGEAQRILRGLGFDVSPREGLALDVGVPTWRSDVSREADLVEEVGRHHGLGRVAPTLPPAREVGGLKPFQVRERRIRDVLVAAGLTEVVNYSFVASASAGADTGEPLRLQNPLSADADVLRRSLLVPGLLATLRTNLRQGRRDVALFEIGRVFAESGEPLPREERRLALLLTGTFGSPHWSERRRPADFYDLKGIVEVVFRRLGWDPPALQAAGGPDGLLHPGRSARLDWNGPIGHLGALHPDLKDAWEIREETLVAELSLERLLEEAPRTRRFQALARFPAVTRDLSALVDAGLTAAELEAVVRDSGGEALRAVTVVDRYAGDRIPAGKVSLTLTLRYQHPERTLTGEEVQASLERVTRALKARGAEIRGE